MYSGRLVLVKETKQKQVNMGYPYSSNPKTQVKSLSIAKCVPMVGTCLTAVHGVAVLFATIAILLSLCVSRLKNLQYLTMLLLLLQ